VGLSLFRDLRAAQSTAATAAAPVGLPPIADDRVSPAWNHAPCALLTCAGNGQILAANATLLTWLGREDDLLPAALPDVLTAPSLLLFETQLRPLLALGRSVDGAFLTLRHADGSTVPVVTNAVQRPGRTAIDLAFLSVREREQYERQLRMAHEHAEAALTAVVASAHAHKMQAVGQMAAGIAHEFNNLLAIVRGNLLFAQQGAEELAGGAHIAADLTQALGATDRAVATVAQLLAFTGRTIVARESLDLNEVIAQAEELLRPALGRDISWQQRLSPTIPRVYAGRDQLQHVLAELVLNARDAIRETGGPGLISISTSSVRLAPDARPGVRLVITDTGGGMTADAVARAFDPFFTTKGPGRGSGLGLSMVYGAINALGGTARLASTVGAGTQVWVELPGVV
jgi:signal transduction histidine kinase